MTTADGSIVGSAAGRIVPGATSAILAVAAGRSIEPGPYQVRLRSRTGTGSETLTTDVSLPAAAASSGAVFVRRGPSTGNKDAPTADFRFRRSDRLRVEFPAGDAPTTARLLDRTGKPMSVPVVTAMRHDADGSQWVSGELALAPLAPGDYVIEIADKSETRMVAFRVVP